MPASRAGLRSAYIGGGCALRAICCRRCWTLRRRASRSAGTKSQSIIGTIAYDAAARAEREHHCFNVFCVRGADTRSRDAMASMKRDVDSLLDCCDAVVAYIGIQFDLPWIRQWQLQSPARGSGAVAADLPGHGRRRIQVMRSHDAMASMKRG